MSETRRDFIKKTAVTTGLVWAAPVIASVPGTAAWASPASCNCTGQATALQSTGTLTIVPQGQSSGAEVCEARFLTPPDAVTRVEAEALCGRFDRMTCTASSDVAFFSGLSVVATVIRTTAQQGCNCDSTGTTSIATLNVAGTPVVVSGPNQVVPIPGVGTLIVNEQVCNSDGSFTVTALRILVTNNLAPMNVAVAQSTAKAPGCTQAACTATK